METGKDKSAAKESSDVPVAPRDDDPKDPFLADIPPDGVARVKAHLKWMRALYKNSGIEVRTPSTPCYYKNASTAASIVS